MVGNITLSAANLNDYMQTDKSEQQQFRTNVDRDETEEKERTRDRNIAVVQQSEQGDTLEISQNGIQSQKEEETSDAVSGVAVTDATDSKEVTSETEATTETEEASDTESTEELEKRLQKEKELADQKEYQEELEDAMESADAEAEEFKDLAKIMEIARRISNGDKVPSSDEKKLMEYNDKLYQMAKSAAMVNQNKQKKEYGSLYDEEDDSNKEKLRELKREDSENSSSESTNSTEIAADDQTMSATGVILESGQSTSFTPGTVID